MVRIAEFDGASRYSIEGEGFGLLGVRPELFDLDEFGSRLDGVPVIDAVIDQETPDGSGRIVVDAEIDSEAFTRLLRAFGGGESQNAELPLLSHSAVLSAASDVTLDYWWSLLGLDEVDGRPARHNVVVCHVQASLAPLSAGDAGVTPIVADPELPMLDDLDAVWELARQRTWRSVRLLKVGARWAREPPPGDGSRLGLAFGLGFGVRRLVRSGVGAGSVGSGVRP